MKSIISRLSAPLLVGSILALGALAFPGIGHSAAADGPTFVFRLKSGLAAPTEAADNGGETGGTGGIGGPSEAPAWPENAASSTDEGLGAVYAIDGLSLEKQVDGIRLSWTLYVKNESGRTLSDLGYIVNEGVGFWTEPGVYDLANPEFVVEKCRGILRPGQTIACTGSRIVATWNNAACDLYSSEARFTYTVHTTATLLEARADGEAASPDVTHSAKSPDAVFTASCGDMSILPGT